MDLPLSPVHGHNINAECYAVTLSVATATNANVRVGISIVANNIAKNIFIYRAICNNSDTPEADVTITHDTAADSHFASTLTPVNQQVGSGATSLATVKGSAAGVTAPVGTSGTVRAVYRLVGSLTGLELFKNGSGIYLPANTASIAASFYVKVPTAAKVGILLIEYIEY